MLPNLVTITSPLGDGATPIDIPDLPKGLTFPFTFVSNGVTEDQTGISISIATGEPANQVLSVLFSAQRLIGAGKLPRFTFDLRMADSNARRCLITRRPDTASGYGTITWHFSAAG